MHLVLNLEFVILGKIDVGYNNPLTQIAHHLFALMVLPISYKIMLDECSNLGFQVRDELQRISLLEHLL